MSERTHINDGFGNQIPITDESGNLSMEVIMLYVEDKITADDRKLVDAFVATDEMSRDALEGYMLTHNSSKTRHTVNELNAAIQQRSGAKPVSKLYPQKKQTFEYRKLAAALAALIVVAAATYFGAQLLQNDEVATVTPKEINSATKATKDVAPKPNEDFSISDSVSATNAEQDKTETDIEQSPKEELEAEFKKVAEENNQTVVKEKSVEKSIEQTQKKESEPETVTAEDSMEESEMAQTDGIESTTDDSEPLANAKKDADSGNQTMDEVSVVTGAANTEPASAMMESADLAYEEVEESSRSRSPQADVSAKKESSTTSARYPGGDLKMYKFIERKKNYPEALKQQGISGTVKVSFDIDQDGRVVNPKITSPLNGILDADALRIVRSMPKWEPATSEGETVKSSRTVNVKYGD